MSPPPESPELDENLRAAMRQASKQVTYPMANISVEEGPHGMMILLIEVPGELLAFPMKRDIMETIGKQMAAPRVKLPDGFAG